MGRLEEVVDDVVEYDDDDDGDGEEEDMDASDIGRMSPPPWWWDCSF